MWTLNGPCHQKLCSCLGLDLVHVMLWSNGLNAAGQFDSNFAFPASSLQQASLQHANHMAAMQARGAVDAKATDIRHGSVPLSQTVDRLLMILTPWDDEHCSQAEAPAAFFHIPGHEHNAKHILRVTCCAILKHQETHIICHRLSHLMRMPLLMLIIQKIHVSMANCMVDLTNTCSCCQSMPSARRSMPKAMLCKNGHPPLGCIVRRRSWTLQAALQSWRTRLGIKQARHERHAMAVAWRKQHTMR